MVNNNSIVEIFRPKKEEPEKMAKLLKGRYKLIKKISVTAMSAVYKAFDTCTNNTVAIKIIYMSKMTSKGKLRWERELILQKLWMNIDTDESINYLVQLKEIFDYNGNSCAVYPWMSESLKDRIREKGRLKLSNSMDIFRKICKGVQIYHNWQYKIKNLELEVADPGIVHRDIKPHNILFDEFNNPKLLDVGISLFRDSRIDNEVNKMIIRDEKLEGFDQNYPKITAEGSVVGSVQYIDPEVTLGNSRKNIPQVDIYSLGILLYEMLTGEVPYNGDNISEIAAQHIRKTPDLLKTKLNYHVPSIVENIITKCTAKNNEYVTLRYKTIEELLADIEKFFTTDAVTETEQLIFSNRTKKKVVKKEDMFNLASEKKKIPLHYNILLILLLWLALIASIISILIF